jgi:hypothetical protein
MEMGQKHVHRLVAAAAAGIATVVIGGTTIVATSLCGAAAADDPFLAFDCYKIGAFGYTLTMTGAASTVAAWKLTKD